MIRLLRLRRFIRAQERIATALEKLVILEEAKQPKTQPKPQPIEIHLPTYDDWQKAYEEQMERERVGSGDIEIKNE